MDKFTFEKLLLAPRGNVCWRRKSRERGSRERADEHSQESKGRRHRGRKGKTDLRYIGKNWQDLVTD